MGDLSAYLEIIVIKWTSSLCFFAKNKFFCRIQEKEKNIFGKEKCYIYNHEKQCYNDYMSSLPNIKQSFLAQPCVQGLSELLQMLYIFQGSY